MKLLHSYGVNRISMGVQTFKPELLKILGRTHKTQDIYNAVEYARKANIESISFRPNVSFTNSNIRRFFR